MDNFSLKGIGGAAGKTTGRIRVFKNIPNVSLSKEEILVVPFTTPKITPFLPKIKAIVTEKGGITSHAAILGREFGLPIVVGVKNATEILKNGQWALVDGSKGKVEVLKKVSMQFAQWDITNLCNLRCRHCRAWKLPKKGELSTEEGIDLLSQLYNLKIQILNFSGGEPFLRKDIFQLLEYARNFPLLTITTNGTLLTDKKCVKQLKKFKNIRISLSLDGMEEFHDDFRQVPGTFKKAVAAIKNLTGESIQTSIKFTLTKSNEDEALKVFELVSRFKIESFNIRAVLPLGRADASLMPSFQRYGEIVGQLLAIGKKKRVSVVSGDPILLPLFPELLGEVWKETGEEVYTGTWAGCLAGDEVLYIKPNGAVGACAYIPKMVGNIREASLVELINKAPLFRALNNCREKLEGRCGGCKFKYLCGGCRAAALALNGDLYAEDPRCLIHNKN